MHVDQPLLRWFLIEMNFHVGHSQDRSEGGSLGTAQHIISHNPCPNSFDRIEAPSPPRERPPPSGLIWATMAANTKPHVSAPDMPNKTYQTSSFAFRIQGPLLLRKPTKNRKDWKKQSEKMSKNEAWNKYERTQPWATRACVFRGILWVYVCRETKRQIYSFAAPRILTHTHTLLASLQRRGRRAKTPSTLLRVFCSSLGAGGEYRSGKPR